MESSAAVTPSINLLFSQLSSKHKLSLLLPAIISSLVAGGVAPFMTYVVGQAFDAFSTFPHNTTPTQQDKDALLRGVGIAALELIGLAFGSVALGSLTSFLWIWTGEINAMALRKAVYSAIANKDMHWFDSNLEPSEDSNQSSIGAGGLMTKFTRETDEVRTATSLASGKLIQYLTTVIASLALAFSRSWSLTLVILSSVPLLIIIQSISQSVAGPLLASERSRSTTAASLIDRALSAIATVKAFNASYYEYSRASAVFEALDTAGKKLNAVWGLTSALSQFSAMAMFVQGFWFGSKLIRDGKAGAGDVMAVFWACLIATSNLQMCVPQLIMVAKGKFAMASLLSLVVDSDSTTGHPKFRALRKIRLPKHTPGELALHDVTFSYPTRPSPVLNEVSLFLPAREMTFVVGSSGSGKSSVAALLMGLYAPQQGFITLDDRDLRYLDSESIRSTVLGVSGHTVILDGKTIYENLVMGEQNIRREKVEEACRVAMLREWVNGLDDGLDTVLGKGGVQMSGGQKQRLALARAWLRDPNVLILDEATSALDATSRVLVFEAVKRWRTNKTTVVITHDLSQISPEDFVYVLKGGRVVEQGYRYDLEMTKTTDEEGGEFRRMIEVQMGGEEQKVHEEKWDEKADNNDYDNDTIHEDTDSPPFLRPVSLGNWMFDVVADLTSAKAAILSESLTPRQASRPHLIPINTDLASSGLRKHMSFQPISPTMPYTAFSDATDEYSPPAYPEALYTVPSRRFSLQLSTPSGLKSASSFGGSQVGLLRDVERDEEWVHVGDTGEELAFEQEKDVVVRSAKNAKIGRVRGVRRRWDQGGVLEVVVPSSTNPKKKFGFIKGKLRRNRDLNSQHQHVPLDSDAPPAFWAMMRTVYPTIPHKPLLFFGLLLCLVSGALTPIFSFFLSKLLFLVSTGATDASAINRAGALVLGITALDGAALGAKYFIMETVGSTWVLSLRRSSLSRVLVQPKSYFDKNGVVPRVVQTLIKDGDDARNLVAVVWGQCLVVGAMVGLGMVWAMASGWELTLVGVAVAPIFAGVMAVQTRLVSECEGRNKKAREDVASGLYETVNNIRGIRYMDLGNVFSKQFDAFAEKALNTGVRGAFVEGCTHGVASGLIYFAEALLFYVGAVLIERGRYTYLQMVQVLNLVVFSVTIGSQLMAFTEKIAKSVQATHDLHQLSTLPEKTSEADGVMRPQLMGDITFSKVTFSYPERPEASILKNLDLTIPHGECVAIVGASGSGKSTIAALLQRLYEPDSGTIAIGLNELDKMDVRHLREHVAVVSQHPHLFDASVTENIRYGSSGTTDADVRRAAKAARVHDFVMGLPMGYETSVGENAALLSGGQAQRLQIARALLRLPAYGGGVLILDECTSALDPENQKAILESVEAVRKERGLTVVMVTHKVEVMKGCDRVVLIGDGGVLEEGRYEQLVRRRGVFATLASGGEWVG